MAVRQETVDRVLSFADRGVKTEERNGREPLDGSLLDGYARRLDKTVEELQAQVKRQEDELRRLRELRSIDFSDHHVNPGARLVQIRRAKKAYDVLLASPEELPDPQSAIPALLAVSETARMVKENKLSIKITAEELSTDRQRLRVEESNLKDAQAIANGLEQRISRVRSEQLREQDKSPAERANELISISKDRIERLRRDTEGAKKSLDQFIEDTLAAMLAAEDLGGPSAGDAENISDAVLEAGFTAHGKPKKPKSAQPEGRESGQQQQQQQQRIDDFLRRGTGQEPRPRVASAVSRREAAASEFHALLNALLEAGTSYIDLPRDSAASRFLVKSKVAQFHPRDARRLRLIDFGRSLDDF